MQSRCIDLESLCITPGEKVLALNVTVSVIDQDGNVNDCSCLAVMAALLSFRYPQITVEGSVIKLVSLFYFGLANFLTLLSTKRMRSPTSRLLYIQRLF